jgi:putative phosphoesterase
MKSGRPKAWRIAVISDTHERLPAHVVEAIRGADEIWHLGDVMSPRVIEMVSTLGPAIRVVRGNCDYTMDWPMIATFTLCGVRFHLEHIPPKRPPETADLLLHGHTHVPRDEMVGGVRYLNPGSVGKPNKGAPASYAWLHVETGTLPTWKIVLV